MKEELRDRLASGPGVAAPAAVVPVPPAVQARRRRLVRVFGLLSLVTGLGLSAIPHLGTGHATTIIDTRPGAAAQVVRVVAREHAFGLPFNTASAEMGPGSEMKSLSLHPEGLLGNLAIAVAAYAVLLFLIARRRRDT